LSYFVVVGMPEHELLKLRPLLESGPGAAAHFYLKGHTKKQVFGHSPKVAILTCYNKLSF